MNHSTKPMPAHYGASYAQYTLCGKRVGTVMLLRTIGKTQVTCLPCLRILNALKNATES